MTITFTILDVVVIVGAIAISTMAGTILATLSVKREMRNKILIVSNFESALERVDRYAKLLHFDNPFSDYSIGESIITEERIVWYKVDATLRGRKLLSSAEVKEVTKEMNQFLAKYEAP
ncbi:MAG: hypothetical protein K0U41_08960, partial [Gammaproteobacteria bacterium]|nr:hypothetical protein [Gammaproteobacteria bacterium]